MPLMLNSIILRELSGSGFKLRNLDQEYRKSTANMLKKIGLNMTTGENSWQTGQNMLN